MTAQAPLMAPFVWSSGGEAVSPDEQKRRRMMAEALIAKGIDTSPVQHWTQGAARVAQALAGNIRLGQIDAEDAAARKAADSDFAALMGGGSAASQPAPANVKLPAPPAPWASGDGKAAQAPENLAPLFAETEKRYGLPAGYLTHTARIESSFNPNARNPNSSAGGLYQFIDSTAKQYGLANKFDPMAATDAAGRLAADNRALLAQALGREPTAGELYLAHQQGGGGAAKLLANPNAPAASLVGMDAVRLNGGRPDMTAGEFASKWISKIPNATPGDAAQAQPLANMPNAPVRMAALGMNDATSPAQQMGLRPPIVQDAALAAPNDPGQVIPPQAAQPAPEPRMQVAQAMMAQPQAQAGSDKMQAIMKVMNNPNSSPGAKAVAQAMLQRQLSQESPQYGFQTVGNQVFRTNPKTGTLEPVMTVPKDPDQVRLQRAQADKAERDAKKIEMDTITSPDGTVWERPKGTADQWKPSLKLGQKPEERTPDQRELAQANEERKAAGLPPMRIDEYKMQKAKAGATNVNVGGGSDKQIFDSIEESAKDAKSAAQGLQSIRDARAAIAGGGIFGFGADARLNLQKAAVSFGVGDASKVVNTETFRAAIAPQVASMLKATVGSANISNSDREFAEKASGGAITLDQKSIERLMDIMERGNIARLEAHQKRLDTVYPDGQNFTRERALFGVQGPQAAAPPQAPSGDAPKPIKSQAEFQSLPSGTRFVAPDGSIRVKP